MTSGADGTVAIGKSSLGALTSGGGNIAVGFEAGLLITDNTDNTIIGHQAFNASDSGDSENVVIGSNAGGAVNHGSSDGNVLIGISAGLGGTGAIANCVAIGKNAMKTTAGNSHTGIVAIGHSALTALTSGIDNTAVGYQAGLAINTGTQNTALGVGALAVTDNGISNTSIGAYSMGVGNAGNYNVAVGSQCLVDVTGNSNVALGFQSLFDLTSGANNIAIGQWSAKAMHVGESGNIALGSEAMSLADEGTAGGDIDNNIAIGVQAFQSGDLAGNDRQVVGNIAIGYRAVRETTTNAQTGTIGIGHEALSALTEGDGNIAIGYQAGLETTIGDNNIYIGYRAAYRTANLNNQHNVFIGYYAGSGDWTSNFSQRNTAVGSLSMEGAMNSAMENTAVGYRSLQDITTGDDNTAIGYAAGAEFTDGHNNVAIGAVALGGSTSVGFATAVGQQAMGSGDVTAAADGTVAIGYQALRSLTSGAGNLAVGSEALELITTGTRNIAIGEHAGTALSTTGATDNVIMGFQALYRATTGAGYNVAIGSEAMGGNWTTANVDACVAIGYEALHGVLTTDASGTVAVGQRAAKAITSGIGNIAIGFEALLVEDDGDNSTAIGFQALKDQTGTSGAVYNTAVGFRAGNTGTNDITSGTQVTLLGANTRASVATAFNETIVGYATTGKGSNSVALGNGNVTNVYMSDDGGAKIHAGEAAFGGDVVVTGKLTATSKSFLIDHPTKKNKKLEHGSLEGPENGVYVRGKVIDDNIIELPEYWIGLVDEDSITVQLTSIGKFMKLYVKKIKDNKVYVEKSGFGKPSFFYNVYGERKDIDKMIVEY